MERNSLCAGIGGKKLIEYWNYMQFLHDELNYTAHLLWSVVSERSSRTLTDLHNIIRQRELNYTLAVIHRVKCIYARHRWRKCCLEQKCLLTPTSQFNSVDFELGSIHRPGYCYRVRVCVCVSLSAIKCNKHPVYLWWAGRRGSTKKGDFN